MLLAIDSSSMSASVAIVDNDVTITEFTVNYKKTHSQTLMPLIKKMFDITEIDLKEIKYVVCAQGPGSFTGLRIGAATAKGLAHGLGIKIIPIPTLDSLAYNIFDTNKLICPIMDARCNQVYGAIYKYSTTKLNILTDYLACDIMLVIDKIVDYTEDVIFLGDGVSAYKNLILKNIPKASFAPLHCNRQRASSLGALAQKLLGKTYYAVDPNEFTLMYLRKSQAEREYYMKVSKN